MHNNLDDRAISLAQYIINAKATIRQTATIFGYSKSTVHNDVSKKLKHLNARLYNQVHLILKNNFEIKHLRGGESTKRKYAKNNIEFKHKAPTKTTKTCHKK